jgi:hypothetical protein
MGDQSDFVGYLHVQPALSEPEIALVNRISGSIYLDRQDGGLRAVDEEEAAHRELTSDAPRGWSLDLLPGLLLEHLMSTFLGPGAAAEGRAGFEAFTCDHVLNGMVVGSRRDNRRAEAEAGMGGEG